MAIAFEGFSIREYASKMRSVDVMKCWPFGVNYKGTAQGDGGEEEEIERLLPPLTFLKFRWWAKEVESLKSRVQEEGEGSGGAMEKRITMICPVCGSFSASTVNAVNAHIDSCLAQASREERRQMRTAAAAKPKPSLSSSRSGKKKKRSIVEIFAVAPQIENMGIACENSEEALVEDEVRENEFDGDMEIPKYSLVCKELKKKKKKKKKQEENGQWKEDAATATVGKLKLQIKKKKKKKNKNNKMSLRIDKKKITIDRSLKRARGPKGQSALDYSAKLKPSLCNKKFEKKNLDSLFVQKRKVSRRKNLSTENQRKVVRAYKSLTEHCQQESAVYPIHSILKNQKKAISCQNSSILENVMNGSQTKNSCLVRQLNRHVSFSGKDDIIGPAQEHSSSLMLPRSKNISRVISDVTDASSAHGLPEEVDNSLPVAIETSTVIRSGEDLANSVINGTRIQSTNENHGQISILPFAASNRRSLQYKEKGLLDEPVNLIQAFPHHENLLQFNQESYASFPRTQTGMTGFLNTSRKEWCNPGDVEPNASGSLGSTTNGGRSVPAHLVAPTFQRSAVSDSFLNINATLQPSASHLSVDTEPVRRLSLPFYDHISSKDLMSSIVQWKKQKTSLRRDNGIYYDDFVGLPLNSQGELIQLNSNGEGNLGHQLKKQNAMKGSVENLVEPRSFLDHPSIIERHYVDDTAVNPKDKLPSFSQQNLLKDGQPRTVFPSEVGTNSYEGTERTDSWKDSPRESTLSIRQLGLDLNLMNISACGCGKINQISNETEKERTVWKDKNSLEACMRPPSAVPTMRLMGKDVAVGRVNNTIIGCDDGKIWTDKEIITEHRPSHFQQELFVNPAVVGKAKEKTICQLLEPEGNINSISPSFSQMKHVNNSTISHSTLGWQAIPQTGHIQNSTVQPYYSNFSAPPLGMMNRALEFPGPCIPQPEPDSLRISSHVPLLNSAQLGCSNQNLIHGTSVFKFPFATGQDCGEYVQSPGQSKCSSRQNLPPWMLNLTQQKAENSLASLSCSDRNLDQHPCSISGANFFPVPSHPPTNSTFHLPRLQTATFGSSSTSAQRPLVPLFPGFKPTTSIGTSYSNRGKAREKSKSKLVRLRDSVRAKKDKKRPAEDKALMECTAKKPNLEMALESTGSIAGLSQSKSSHNAEVDARRDKGGNVELSPIVNFSNVDNSTRSGTIKLSAGAKHILKPSRKNDLDNSSRPVHATIPFGAVSNSNRVTEIQKKSAKVYRGSVNDMQ